MCRDHQWTKGDSWRRSWLSFCAWIDEANFWNLLLVSASNFIRSYSVSVYHKTFLATLCLSQWFLKTYTFAVSAILTVRRWRLWGKSTNKSVILICRCKFFYLAFVTSFLQMQCLWLLYISLALAVIILWSECIGHRSQSQSIAILSGSCSAFCWATLRCRTRSYQVWQYCISRSPRGCAHKWKSRYKWAKLTRKMKKITPNLPKMNVVYLWARPDALQRGLLEALFSLATTNKHLLKMIDGAMCHWSTIPTAPLTPPYHHLAVFFLPGVSGRPVVMMHTIM